MSQFRYLILNTRLQFAQAQADSVCFPVAWYHLIVTLGALILSSTLALAQRVPFQVGNDNFTSEGLVKGMQASPAHCSQVTHAVWARTEHHGEECIRYWMAGLEGSAKPSNVLVYIPGDQLVFDSPDADYAKRSPASMQLIAEGIYARVKVPVVLLSRPGIFGSSGEHKLRREAGESRLMSAALDQIKARHAVANYSLVGLSGGGHIVASLAGLARRHLVCGTDIIGFFTEAAVAPHGPNHRFDRQHQVVRACGHAPVVQPFPSAAAGFCAG
ncbi:MAG: hypothetical protein IPG42_00405 [Betaproteobacteria bacterium]|nr:hypothetical protein [Betaproteobacteria bacterium]